MTADIDIGAHRGQRDGLEVAAGAAPDPPRRRRPAGTSTSAGAGTVLVDCVIALLADVDSGATKSVNSTRRHARNR